MAAVRREFYVQMNHLIENENGLETIDCLHMVSFPILLHIHMTPPSTQSFLPDPFGTIPGLNQSLAIILCGSFRATREDSGMVSTRETC